jgi:hypothetical protein
LVGNEEIVPPNEAQRIMKGLNVSEDRKPLCPSASPDLQGSRLIGVVGGTADAPETAYLPAPQPVTEELLELAKPVAPTEVFRFAAPCACSGCAHFVAQASKCRLVEKVVRFMPVVVERLPVCAIRPNCRWWQQEGRAACLRCPQVVTRNLKPTEAMHQAADPSTV